MIQNLSDLKPGQKLRVIQDFYDFDKDLVDLNTVWTFKKSSYFPFDGGYIFEFEEGGIRLAEIDPENVQVLQNPGAYFVLV